MKKTIKALFTKKMPVCASKYLYYMTFKKRLNLIKPTTFNEKLMWLKLFEDDSLKITCADKYLVRNYIRKLGYSDLLIDLHEVYEHVEEINFEKLPKSFVMKCTHGSGFNIICPDKKKIDEKQIKMQIENWMEIDYGTQYCEPHYSSIKPRITVERFLDKLNDSTPIDYKIHCFHGEPHVIEVELNDKNSDKQEILFNCDWEILPYNEASINYKKAVSKPERLNEMLEIAKALSKIYTYVRVDLYYCNNEIYFGELTFTPAACLDRDFINDGEYRMGELLDLSLLKKVRQPKFSLLEYLK